MPDRADGVDDVLRGQAIAPRQLGVTGIAPAERPAFGDQIRSRCGVDGAVDTASAEQSVIGGVDDRVDLQLGDVRSDGGELGCYASP